MRNANVPTVTDRDLVEQFTLARQISDKVTVAHDAVLRIRSLKDQIAARTAANCRRAAQGAGEALVEKLTAVEGEIYQYRNRSNQDPLNYPIRLNNKLAALQGTVESGDAQADRPVVRRVQGSLGAARQGTGAPRCAGEIELALNRLLAS